MGAAAWVWRLSLAAPATSAAKRLEWARLLAATETSEHPRAKETWRGIERRLLHSGVEPEPCKPT